MQPPGPQHFPRFQHQVPVQFRMIVLQNDEPRHNNLPREDPNTDALLAGSDNFSRPIGFSDPSLFADEIEQMRVARAGTRSPPRKQGEESWPADPTARRSSGAS